MVAVSIENNNSLVPSFDLALRSLPPPGPQFQGRPEKPHKIWSKYRRMALRSRQDVGWLMDFLICILTQCSQKNVGFPFVLFC